jgi:hypothetical protein
MKLHARGRVAAVTAVAFCVVSSGLLASGTASATPSGAAATARPAVRTIYYCEGNICMGTSDDDPENPDIAVHADEYEFYGHFELQTPKHKTFNSRTSLWRTGPSNGVYFGIEARDGKGKYCGTAWDGDEHVGYKKIGYICKTF